MTYIIGSITLDIAMSHLISKHNHTRDEGYSVICTGTPLPRHDTEQNASRLAITDEINLCFISRYH